MRLFLLAALLAAIYSAAPALADIAPDLKFCIDLKNGKERLACYDAAVRIGKKGISLPIERALQSQSTPKPAKHSPYGSNAKFDGAYVGFTGGYDFRGLDTFSANPFSTLSDGKIGGVVGYSSTAGRLLVGFEARGQYSFAKREDVTGFSNSFGYSFPSTVLSLTCYSCDQTYFDNFPVPVGGALVTDQYGRFATTYTRPWQVDFSLRVGITFDDWLIFAKLGAGVEQSRIAFLGNERFGYCTSQYQKSQPTPNSLKIDLVGCGSSSSTSYSYYWARTYYNPVLLLGAGLEKTFGNYFLRAEAELISHLDTSSGYSYQPYYSPAVNVTAGYRF